MEPKLIIDASNPPAEPVEIPIGTVVALLVPPYQPKGFVNRLGLVPCFLKRLSSDLITVDYGNSGKHPRHRYLFRAVQKGEGHLVLELQEQLGFWQRLNIFRKLVVIGGSSFAVRTTT